MSDINWFEIINKLVKNGMPQKQQAKEIGVTRKTINNWKNGKVEDPPYSKANKLLDIYHTVIGST
jgi:DNA-binding XRE family transcriptional regulator